MADLLGATIRFDPAGARDVKVWAHRVAAALAGRSAGAGCPAPADS